MLRFSTSLMTMGAALAICGMAEANDGRSTNAGNRTSVSARSVSSSSNSWSSSKNSSFKFSSTKSSSNYHLKNGTKFDKGFCYKGKYHDHWSHYCWNYSYGCYLYYDPCCYSWYYWCEPAFCYYPVSYCPYGSYTPAPGAVAVEGPPTGGPQGQPGDSEQEPPQAPAPLNGASKVVNQPQGLPNLAAGTNTRQLKGPVTESGPTDQSK